MSDLHRQIRKNRTVKAAETSQSDLRKAGSARSQTVASKKSSNFSNVRKASKLFRTVSLSKGADTFKTQVTRSKMVKIIKKKFKRDAKEDNDEGDANYPPTQPPLYPQLRDSWLVVKPSHIAKDLHRLIYRITVKTSGINNTLMEPPPLDERKGGATAAKAVIGLIKLLAHRLLEEEESVKIAALCDKKVVTVDEKTDLYNFNNDLFMLMGENNAVVRVLRCVHQSMVLKPYGILRTVMLKNKLTKDVRGDQGWQIEITVAHEGFVQVIHRRREQSIDRPTKNQPQAKLNHWEYKWEVSMTFDRHMKDMTASRLSITDLILDESMDPDLEKELRETLQDGNITVF